MKRKAKARPEGEETSVSEVTSEPVVAQQDSGKVPTQVPCIVCGSESRSDLAEQLCWVCRRLKISAWRDSDAMPLQE